MHARSSRTASFVLFLALLILVTVFYRGKELISHPKLFLSEKLPHDTPFHQAHLNDLPLSTQTNRSVESATNTETEPSEHAAQAHSTSSTANANDQNTNRHEEDPCRGRPQPVPIPPDARRPPSLYFLHIPKTAGTLIHQLGIRYANKTNGLACQYTYDGNRFGPGDYHLSVKPPPQFFDGSLEKDTIDAINARNVTRKLELLRNGACRTMRGHVTYKQREYMGQPILSLTIVRDPIERFISMYEFAMMMVRSRPGTSGWDHLISGDIEADFRNASSLLHRSFYDTNGSWIARGNVGFSFHFYGVLHQLSGITPVFEGEGVPEQFRIANADELAEKAKDNICSTHILGAQSDMGASLDLLFTKIAPFSTWTEAEMSQAKSSSVNKNLQKKKTAGEGWSETMRANMQKRFQHETDVHAFALRVIKYRQRPAQPE